MSSALAAAENSNLTGAQSGIIRESGNGTLELRASALSRAAAITLAVSGQNYAANSNFRGSSLASGRAFTQPTAYVGTALALGITATFKEAAI